MASRKYLASFSHAQLGLLTAASSSRVTVPAICRRSYASAAAVATNKNRPPATARKTASTDHLSSASNPKVSVKTASRTHVSAGGPAAKAAAKNARPKSATAAATPVAQEKPKVPTEKEQIEQLDQILSFSQHMPTADVWGQKVDTLDVMIPYNVITSRHRFKGFSRLWAQFWQNRLNDIKNMISMTTLAGFNAIPGVNTGSDGFFQKFFTWPLRIFSAKSVSSTAWLALMRQQALENYKDLYIAIAKNDTKSIRRLTTDSFLAETLAVQKKHNPNCTYIWRLHREVNPIQIVSIRVTEGYLAPEEPKFGNRLMVHALAKFDTEQSLEIYDRRGNALHLPTKYPHEVVKGPAPAEAQRVVQYLVLEKRMWYDGPWLIREQVWEVNPKKS